jgi:DNA-binding transcriptional MerR regulator
VMNEIIRVTNKPVKLIDALRSDLAKEARRLSDALHAWSPLDTLAENVSAAEVMVATPEYQALVGALQAAFEPASVADITRELGLLLACYPSKDVDISVLVAFAVEEVIRERPSVLRLLVSTRRIRRTYKFRPSMAEIIEALEDAGSAITKAKQILELPQRLERAMSDLARLVNVELNRVKELLSDRLRRLDSGKSVSGVDEQLKSARGKLARVLAQRVTAPEPQRLLVTQSISITENEKVTVPW